MEDKPDYGLNTPFCDDTIGEISACLFYWTKLDNYVNQIKPSFGGFVWCFVLNVEFGEDCPWPDHLLSLTFNHSESLSSAGMVLEFDVLGIWGKCNVQEELSPILKLYEGKKRRLQPCVAIVL